MKKLLITAFAAFSLQCFSQDGYEILIYETNVDHFDVYGNDDYEKHNRSNNDITEYLIPEGVVKDKAEPIVSDNFEAKNMFDGNMKTCWLTAGDGKNEVIEIVIDIEENAEVPSAEIRSIYFANGWRKDMQTWKNYSASLRFCVSASTGSTAFPLLAEGEQCDVAMQAAWQWLLAGLFEALASDVEADCEPRR